MPNKIKAALKKVKDKRVLDFMERFEFAYNKMLPDLQRIEAFHNLYNNTINEAAWPTHSKMPIPLMFTSVERAIGPAMEYLFPKGSRMVRLTPLERGVPMDSIEKTEWALQHTVRSKMKLPFYAVPTVKNCFRSSVGYGIIEPIVVTPPTALINRAFADDREIARTRIMSVGSPRRSVRYRDLTQGQVIVTPDGSDFNGPKRVSIAFFLDSYHEDDFRAMYSDNPTDGEKPLLEGKVDAIIDEARMMGFTSTVPIVNVVANLGGKDIRMINDQKGRVNVEVPVLKCYTGNRHLWIANGTQVIFDQQDEFQTLRCPLIKCSAWPDGDQWVPMSTPEAMSKIAVGLNIWVGALYDLMSYALNPLLLWDKTKTGNKPPERGPNSTIGVAGDTRNAVEYVEHPQIPPAVFNVGELLQRFLGNAAGQENFLTNVQPGLMRGGAYSFESLLQSATGRERLAGSVLETGFMEPAMLQTLIYMQLNITEEGDIFRMREWSPETGREYISEMNVTMEDMVNAYELELTLQEKHRNSAIDQQTRLAEFNALNGDRYTDQYQLRAELIQDEDKSRRLFLPRERAQEIQEQERLLEVAAQLRGRGGPGVAAPAAETRQEQALEGAARVGGGL